MKKIYFLCLAAAIWACEPPAQQNTEQEKPKEEVSEKKEKPKRKTKKESNNNAEKLLDFGLPTGHDGQVLTYTGFTLCYDENHEQAAWVTYEITQAESQSREAERENDFREDPNVKTGSAIPADYKGSGYDRGHLAPAGDMRFSKDAMSESFFLSNISPQDKDLNREMWRELEEKIRLWAIRDKNLIIVTGPLLKGKLSKIGKKNEISVPKFYYKVILDYSEPQLKGIAFIMPNKQCTKEMPSYAVSIDKVEQETGLNFFPNLDAQTEQILESKFDTTLWFD